MIHWSEPYAALTPEDGEDGLDETYYGFYPFAAGGVQMGFLNTMSYVSNEMGVRLVYSRNGKTWHHLNKRQPFLTPRGEGHWDAYMATITHEPIRVGDELFIYHGGSSNHHDWWISGAREGLDVPEVTDPDGVNYALGLAKLRVGRVRLSGRRPHAARHPGDAASDLGGAAAEGQPAMLRRGARSPRKSSISATGSSPASAVRSATSFGGIRSNTPSPGTAGPRCRPCPRRLLPTRRPSSSDSARSDSSWRRPNCTRSPWPDKCRRQRLWTAADPPGCRIFNAGGAGRVDSPPKPPGAASCRQSNLPGTSYWSSATLAFNGR